MLFVLLQRRSLAIVNRPFNFLLFIVFRFVLFSLFVIFMFRKTLWFAGSIFVVVLYFSFVILLPFSVSVSALLSYLFPTV